MSIYFNLNDSKLEFVLQQNNNEYFAVNFLNTHVNGADFGSIINEVIGKEDFPLKKLSGTCQVVILPSCAVGYGMISVPKTIFHAGRDFETKFNALYNKAGNMAYDKFHLFSKNNVSTYSFMTYRKDLLSSIEISLKKYNIKVAGFTTYARAVNKFVLSKFPELSGMNFLALYGGDYLTASANIANKILSSMDKNLSQSNLLAKAFVNNALENTNKTAEDNNSHNGTISLEKGVRASLFLHDYENYYNSNGIKFDKIINLSQFNIMGAIDLPCESSDILKIADRSIIISKKGFFSL